MRSVLRGLLYSILVAVSFPFFLGAWYSGCGDRYAEQAWLNRAVRHLKVLRLTCHDPEVCDVLDYTIRRYNHIGPWDVMVMPLTNPRGRTLGANWPFCPGITLDPEVLGYPIHEGALILAHEACHDYWPYFHPYVDPLVKKVEAL
jgi:hypothetical protein